MASFWDLNPKGGNRAKKHEMNRQKKKEKREDRREKREE
jgi:hypothetical protein